MAEEKNRVINKDIGEEILRHRKKSKSAARSVADKRSDHKHEYEKVIIRNTIHEEGFFWGERCRICGRVKDGDWFKEDAYKDFVKKRVKVKGFNFKVFYKLPEIRKMYPGIAILANKEDSPEYEQI